jgi:hypothetical protein
MKRRGKSTRRPWAPPGALAKLWAMREREQERRRRERDAGPATESTSGHRHQKER